MGRNGWSLIVIMLLGGCSIPSTSTPAVKVNPSIPSVMAKNSDENPFCCSVPDAVEPELRETDPKISDLERFSQEMLPYVEKNGIDQDAFYESQKNFEKYYFLPWSYLVPPMSANEASWPLRAFRGGYGSNLRIIPPQWFQTMLEESNFNTFGTVNQKGLTLKWMDIRALPSNKPLYKNPSLPGDGYPFDLLQNSSVNYHEPIFISHTSKDGAWSYIFTNNASGWVPSEGVMRIDDENISSYMKSEKVFLIQDNIPLYDSTGQFVVYSRVGMVLPLEKIGGEFYHVKILDPNATAGSMLIPRKSARLGVQKINKSDLIALGSEMLRNTYGWGGMFGERDCSSMIRDMVTPFGIWLPRNSSAQARKGEIVSFEGLSDSEKIALIKEKAIAFETILYLKGHVVLYLGIYEDTVMVMHNIWGIRTIDKEGNKGRRIVGKTVISTLEFGSELEDYDEKNKLLTRIQSMNIFTKPYSFCVARKKTQKQISSDQRKLKAPIL